MFHLSVTILPAAVSALLSFPLAYMHYLEAVANPPLVGSVTANLYFLPGVVFFTTLFMLSLFTPTGGNPLKSLVASVTVLMIPVGVFVQTGFQDPWTLAAGVLMVFGIGMCSFLFAQLRPTL